MKRLAFSLVTCLAVAPMVQAGGLSDPIVPVAPPPPAPAPIPLDFYLGLQAGIVSGDIETEATAAPAPSIDFEGPIYGIHAGLRREFGPVTLGIEGDWNTTNVDLEDSGTDVVIEMDRLAHLKLQAGADLNGVFIYGTAGMAFASMTIENFGPPLDLEDSAPVYGLGADFMVNQSISVGAEYLVHDFEDMDDSGVDVGFNTLMLRASFHF